MGNKNQQNNSNNTATDDNNAASGNQPAPATNQAATDAATAAAAPANAATATAAPAAPALTQADIDNAVAAALKAKDDELKKEQDRAQLSKEERLQLELDETKRENLMIKAEKDVVEALKAAGAKTPQLLFEAKKGALEFKDGKLTNLTEVVASLKLTYADQFGEEKPAQSIDAGTGSNQSIKEKPETLIGALKDYYKKK